jgi:hypothetical protein
MTDVRRVQVESDTRDHIVKLGMFFDGDGRALCGRKPFPERWTQPVLPSERELCAGCRTALRGRT